MKTQHVFRHRIELVIIGGIGFFISLLFLVEGVFSIVVGLSPDAQRASVNFAVFAGTVFVVISVLGIAVAGLLLRWKRVLRCTECGHLSDIR